VYAVCFLTSPALRLQTLSSSTPPELLQQFVPELQSLRRQHYQTRGDGVTSIVGQQFEVFAAFKWPTLQALEAGTAFGVCLMGQRTNCTALLVSCSGGLEAQCVVAARERYDATAVSQTAA
jgi:hypothetical protein